MGYVSFSELQTCQLFERRRDESFNSITDLNGSGESSILDAICLVNSITGLNGSGKSNILDVIFFALGITNMPTVRAHRGRGQGLQRRCIVAPEDEYDMAEEAGAYLQLVRSFVLGITNMSTFERKIYRDVIVVLLQRFRRSGPRWNLVSD
ncbi:uncharacterized protein FMAN_15328 [Fusarium mangiferae]|uniref:RecF/RecN/SMC N-terminal domain-containing protein n=1 Tax=Fusarium mangiferae TaxID=192010 RepID=A0A1L7U9Y2_FUSMA|nr:uncharacterized protein FMAN_15328 [Fusarium mangiferae]CVL07209.1 uncharacterized protein FMAN_15328 [Fusarium mangiferae]